MTYTSLSASPRHLLSRWQEFRLQPARSPRVSLTMLVTVVVVATIAVGAFSPPSFMPRSPALERFRVPFWIHPEPSFRERP